jgi:stage IV sporulation protein FB
MPFANQSPARLPKGSRALSYNTAAKPARKPLFKLHPLFLAVGIWYAFTGELFLFLLSALVAIQHECAHAFASASLGYKLNKIILMPYGAVIDGDLKGISFQDEIFVALCGPLCNLLTAGFFVALWWLAPTTYAFTDTACYSSLSIALVNLLPAYPLDGGRILKCALARAFMKTRPDEGRAEKKAEKICRAVTLIFAAFFLIAFGILCARSTFNFSLLAFGFFLSVGAFGNRNERATYYKLDLSCRDALKKGTELRRVAVLESCTTKRALRFLARGSYLVLEVYDKNEKHLFDLSQNELADLFANAASPYETLGTLYQNHKNRKNFTRLSKKDGF